MIRPTGDCRAANHEVVGFRRTWVAVMLGSAVLAGCVHAQSSTVQPQEGHTQAVDGVAILAMEPFVLGTKPCDPDKITKCVSRAIVRLRRELRVIPPKEFSYVAFPGLKITEAPRQPEYIALLLEDEGFRARIAPLRVRYLVVIGGSTTTRKLWGDVLCGAGYGGGGCFGVTTTEEETRMSATVFDVERIGRRHEVTASHQESEYFGMFIVFPFFKPAATMSGACRSVAFEILTAMDDLKSNLDDRPSQPESGSKL